MAEKSERPTINVAVVRGATPSLYEWVLIGAEEEGVPTKLAEAAAGDVVDAAYAAAISSRIDIGVAIGTDAIVLHERHMPPQKPVLTIPYEGKAEAVCRRAGANAARMVARLPLLFEDAVEDVDERVRPASERRAAAQSAASVPAKTAAALRDGNGGGVPTQSQARAEGGAGRNCTNQQAAETARRPAGEASPELALSEADIRKIVKIVVAIIKERGTQWR
ncbi:glycerol dehydratase reactivase beta/small subunit family protein [Afifella sp. YEN Y35]|uniref:glycerol dehydratase reactivase beta/small subunit family protein n=1 Tax=Afifella sp. YEN Y35 TaxID=3388337 RepID=UPI0039DFE73B